MMATAQQHTYSHDTRRPANGSIEDELAGIDRALFDLVRALEPLRADRSEAPGSRLGAETPAAIRPGGRPAETPVASRPEGRRAAAPVATRPGGAPVIRMVVADEYDVRSSHAGPTVAPHADPMPTLNVSSVSPVLAAIALLRPAGAPTEPLIDELDAVVLPVLESVRPRAHGGSGWLGGAIRRLAHSNPAVAARAIIALLPMQGDVIADEVSYDLVVTGETCHAVNVERNETSIRRVSMPRPLATIDARIEARIDQLGAITFPARVRALRRSDTLRIHGRGRKKAIAALRALATAPVSLSEARGAGVKLTDELLLAVVAAGIAPEWTIGHRFTIAVQIEDAGFGEPSELFVRVNDGAAVTLSRGLPLDVPSATLSCTSEALANVLLGQSVGLQATLAGERAPVMLMQGWVARLESGRG